MTASKKSGVSVSSFSIRVGSDGGYEYPKFDIVISNKTKNNWDGVIVDAFFVNAMGEVIEASASNSCDDFIAAGDSKSVSVNFYISGIDKNKLLPNLEGCSLYVKADAFGIKKIDLGEFDIPSVPFDFIRFENKALDEGVQIVGGGISRGEVDDDKEVEITAKILISNQNARRIAEVNLSGDLLDKSGKEFGDLGNTSEVAANSFQQINGFSTIKERKVKGAKAKMRVKAKIVLETMFALHNGVVVEGEAARSASAWGFPGNS